VPGGAHTPRTHPRVFPDGGSGLTRASFGSEDEGSQIVTDIALRSGADPLAQARLHGLLRFGVGATAAMVLAEFMGWAPSFLPPLFTAFLLANLPGSPPFKVGVVLVGVITVAAVSAFALTSLLLGTPAALYGVVSIVIFSALYTMAKGKLILPMLLALVCYATIPVVTMVVPAYGDLLPTAMVRAMAVAVGIIWLVYALWPQVAPPPPKPAPPSEPLSPLRIALTGTAIIMPLLLAFLVLGLTDALPVLITTVMLVATFDVTKGAVQGMVMVLGNLFGGFIAFVAVAILATIPSLLVLGLLIFLLSIIAAEYLSRGGALGAIALLTFNQTLVMFSIALADPSASAGLWLTRLLQFCLAWLFAIGMMWLAMPRRQAA